MGMTQTQLGMAHEAVGRATQGKSVMNYPSILEGFMAKGIELADIKPRENVFTFWAWSADRTFATRQIRDARMTANRSIALHKGTAV